ncbi:NAD+ synthase [Coralliovum pocilloporae]|uniref:NAD+ synthase n=1 Tax=Coralliovum pocilloporae TaxID=3066369 RepID=UPI0033076A50
MTHLLENRIILSLAQINPTVGDIDGNMEKARAARLKAAEDGADLLVLPELFVSGYPPEDLVLKPAFQRACREAVEAFAKETADGGPGVLIGTPWVTDDALWNAVCLLDNGTVESVQGKVELPNYGVFDEVRVFDQAPLPGPMGFRGLRLGAPICEDIWFDQVCECLMETGAEMLIVLNGSPYARGKADQRMQVAVARVVETELPLVYLNQVCGQDELVFEGASFGLNADRTLAFQMAPFQEEQVNVVMERADDGWRCTGGPVAALPDRNEETWQACVLGLRDYVNKNGFPGVVLGLSGGIDSAVCAAMAVDALGADRVHSIMLPYRYTSDESLSDAARCAEALGIRYDNVPISEPVEGFLSALDPLFSDTQADTTEENLQSRTRGTILMAVSNKFGAMVVTTGNKSEVSVGYATLYGDMNGGFNPIKDLYKTEVYALARWRNANHPTGLLGPEGEVIPANIIDKAPTAELRENQTDQDSLPDYDVLDDILDCLVEREMALDDIVAKGHDKAVVERVQHLLYIAEYKRRQAAPGVRVTDKNFGKDRRYPITNRYRDRVKG